MTQLLTIAEVAARLRVVSERTVRREIARGHMKTRRIGRGVFVTDTEVERYITASDQRRA